MIVHQSFQYAQNVVNGTIPAPKYVIKQCQKFLEICDGKSEKYFLDEQKLNQIDDVLKLLIMPRGLKAGNSIYECSCGYQWILYAAALCVVYREKIQPSTFYYYIMTHDYRRDYQYPAKHYSQNRI